MPQNLPADSAALQMAIVKSRPFSNVTTDPEGVIQLFNAGAERLFGYTAAEVLDELTAMDLHDPDEVKALALELSVEFGMPIAPGFEALVFKAARGIVELYDLTNIRKDGSRFPAALSVTALRDDEEAIIGYLLIAVDNTRRKQADAALRHSEAQLKFALTKCNAGAWDLDLVDHTTHRTLDHDRIFGYATLQPAWTYEMFLDHVLPEDRDDVNRRFTTAVANESDWNFECRIRRADGQVRWIWGSGELQRDAPGGARRMAGIVQDVTARKESQSACEIDLGRQTETARALRATNTTLRDSEERLAVTLRSIGDGVIATDAEARVTSVNPVAETLTGWRQRDAIGRPVEEIFQVINQESRLAVPIPVRETLALGATKGLPHHPVLVARDGEERAIADSCAPIRDREGSVVGSVLVFRNVTAERAQRQTAADAAALKEAILNTVVDGVITFNATTGVVKTVNPAAKRMFGYAAREIVGKGFSLLSPGWSGPNEAEAFAAQASGGEFVGRRKDGSEFHFELALSEMQQGGEQYYTGVIRDISARKEAEEALLKEGALQNAIFNSANFSCIATDASGVIQIFNVGAERMLGYTAAEVMNKVTPADISDPREVVSRAKELSAELGTPIAPGFEALVFKASRGIEDIYELTLFRKDGSRLPALVSVTALRDGGDVIIGYLLIGTDNTARKQVEAEQKVLDQRLRDQQFYTRSLIESNVDALMTTDPAGILTDVNKQMEALTGCTRDELIGAPFKNYFTDPERAEAGIKLVLREKKVTNYELTTLARDGTKTVVSYNATTFYDRDRKLQGVFAAARDITERKRADQALQDKHTELEGAKFVAERANLAKSEFLSSMSHELRTPLNAILGFAQLMDSDIPSPTNVQKGSIDQILHAGWYLLELINEILDLAQIESGKMSLSTEPVSLSDVLRECEAMIGPQGKGRGIDLTFPVFPFPQFVLADRTRLKQVLINLLSNSIKYNRPGGSVAIQCTALSPERTRISVCDTGAGLLPDQMALLFQPFNRLGRERSTEEGTGIGLVMSKRLVELMGGTIGLTSTVGEGSEFWFDLNAALAPAVEDDTSDVDEPRKLGRYHGTTLRTLLYVEDNPANLALVEQLMARRPDMRLMSAGDADVGIELARANRPEVILMDINLPGISGIQAREILAQDQRTAHIPVIALSANAMPRDIENGLRAGFFHYLTKPIKVREFMNVLDLALEFVDKQG